MPEIIIQEDGSLLIPRGLSEDNQFFRVLIENMTTLEELDALSSFFSIAEDSEVILGQLGLCG